MTCHEWVLDNWVLVTSCTSNRNQMNAVTLLNLVLLYCRIALDHDGLIEGEYHPYIYAHEHLRLWWEQMISIQGKIYHRDGHLPERHRQFLVNSGRVGNTDGACIAVASNGTPTKLLVTEDGDFSTEVIEYCKDHLSVDILDLTNAVLTTSTHR